jgi:basic amino acid/polyamine antiporter, APA family
MASKKQKPVFKEVIGDFGALAISLGGIIGSGIFFILGIATGEAGSGIILSLILAGIIAVLTALSFAELGSKITKEGGEYQFVYSIFGPQVGFFVGILWIASTAIAGVTVSVAFASYLTRILPLAPINVIAAVTCVVFTLIDVLGIKLSSSITGALVIIKASALILFILLALPSFQASNLGGMLDKGGNGIFIAAFLVFFAYAGFGKVTAASEEIKNASKTVPRAILISVSFTAFLYILAAVAAIGAVGANVLSSPEFRSAPLANVMLAIGSEWGFFVILAGALTATSSVLLIQLLGVSRNIYAMSVNKQLPAFLSKLHPRFKTPYRAELIIGLMMAVIALVLNTMSLVALTGFGILGYYAIINIAAIVLKRREAKSALLQTAISSLGFVLCMALILYFFYTLFRG